MNTRKGPRVGANARPQIEHSAGRVAKTNRTRRRNVAHAIAHVPMSAAAEGSPGPAESKLVVDGHALLQETGIIPIASYVTGERVADNEATTVYESVGAAFYDLYVAHAMYRAAQGRGVGREVRL